MSTQATVTPERLRRILKRAVPNRALRSYEPLTGGATNLNYLVQFHDAGRPVVIRFLTKHAAACGKEVAILKSAFGVVPVPQIVSADPEGEEGVGPYIIYEYVEGVTFQELKQTGNLQDMAEASYAIGRALAQMAAIGPPPALLQTREISVDNIRDSAVLEQRIGGSQRDLLSRILTEWMPQIRSFNQERAVVHGDFNNRNTIIKRQANGRWMVSAILDWELAYAGCPLWDAARFICYERPERPYREPHFSRGYSDGGGNLPKNWTQLARMINLLTAADSLTRPDLPSAFIPELCGLVGGLLA